MLSDEKSMELSSGIAAFEAKEFRRAWQLLQPLSDGGESDAQYRCAIMLQNGLGVIARPKVAAQIMTSAADQQHALAQHSLGIMFLFGEGVEQNTTKAIDCLERAGESGLMGSWSTLGMIYTEGRGIEKDLDRGRAYYMIAGFDPDEFE